MKKARILLVLLKYDIPQSLTAYIRTALQTTHSLFLPHALQSTTYTFISLEAIKSATPRIVTEIINTQCTLTLSTCK